jgi:hypothetical protein
MNKKNIVAIGDKKNNLSWVSPLVRMNQDVFKTVFFKRSDNFLERYAPPSFEALIFVWIPPERLHELIISGRVPFVITFEKNRSVYILSELVGLCRCDSFSLGPRL